MARRLRLFCYCLYQLSVSVAHPVLLHQLSPYTLPRQDIVHTSLYHLLYLYSRHCSLYWQLRLPTVIGTNLQPLKPLSIPTMCTVQYTLYSCEHWVPEPQRPDGEVLRICKQAEEERLGFACPQTQREHKVVNRSQGPCRDCMWKNILR